MIPVRTKHLTASPPKFAIRTRAVAHMADSAAIVTTGAMVPEFGYSNSMDLGAVSLVVTCRSTGFAARVFRASQFPDLCWTVVELRLSFW